MVGKFYLGFQGKKLTSNGLKMGQILPKISIFEEVNENFKSVKLGMKKNFLEKISKVVFHRFLGEISLKKWFFKIFAKNN